MTQASHAITVVCRPYVPPSTRMLRRRITTDLNRAGIRTRVMQIKTTGTVAAALVALALAACGSSSSSSSRSSSGSTSSSSSSASSAAPASGDVTVAIGGYKFHPAAIVVTRGTKVTFANRDQTAHTATAGGASGFDSGTIKPGARDTVTFRKAGTYAYICQFHAFMHGTVVVK
jgi:plastocyanin